MTLRLELDPRTRSGWPPDGGDPDHHPTPLSEVLEGIDVERIVGTPCVDCGRRGDHGHGCSRR